MKSKLRIFFSVTTDNNIQNCSTAMLESITKDRIQVRTKKPINFTNFQNATIRAIYGNQTHIMFFLNDYIGAEKKDGYVYTFLAPKKKHCNFYHQKIDASCGGYEKLYRISKPKRVGVNECQK